MAIRVQAQGQTFEFKDGTTEAQIGEALDSHFGGQSQPVQQQPQQISPQGLTPKQPLVQPKVDVQAAPQIKLNDNQSFQGRRIFFIAITKPSAR